MMLRFNISASPSPLTLQNPRPCSRPPSSSLLPSATSLLHPEFSRVLAAAHRYKRLYVACRRSDYFQQQDLSSMPTNNSSFVPHSPVRGGEDTGPPPRIFVGHTIYKGKAALTVEPRGPEFASLDSGAFKLSKEGFSMLQFAPASGLRQYDWTRKQVFSLSVTEIGTLISLGANDSFEFFHDPNKGRSDEGKIRKLLKVAPLPDGSGHSFNLSVQNKSMNVDESIYIPITRAEFAVIISALNFILPYLMGWHAYASSIRLDDPGRSNYANARSGAELEWSR